MKIQAVQTIYIVTTPFSTIDKMEILERILLKEIIVSGIKKEDLDSIRITTTRGDRVCIPKAIRLEVDSRHLSKEKLEKILNKGIAETKIMFLPQNIH